MRPTFRSIGLDNIGGFVLLSLGAVVFEESLVYLLGGTLAQPVLWVDIVWIGAIWLAWLLTWDLWVSRRYSFTESEALLIAGGTGILYEVGISRAFLLGPLAILVLAPLPWVVYAVVFLWPLQLMDFPTRNEPPSVRVLAGLLVPFATSVAVALILWVLLRFLGVPVR